MDFNIIDTNKNLNIYKNSIRLYQIIIYIFYILFLYSCEFKKDAIGFDDEIRVVCSKEDESIVKNFLKKIFNDTLYTPAPEPYYKLIFSEPGAYTKLKKYSQIIIASVNKDENNIGYRLINKLLSKNQVNISKKNNPIFITRDLFSNNQVYGIINAIDKEHLFDFFEKNSHLMKKHFENQFSIRSNKFLFENRIQTDLEDSLQINFGWNIKIPWGWEIIKKNLNENFIWIGNQYPYRWLSVNWKSGNLVNDRLAIGKEIWDFPNQHYKSIRFNDYKFNFKVEKFNNYRSWVCNGVWESIDSSEAKGGPFQSFVFYDFNTDRTFHINTLVHNPGENKALYIRQMELIAKSFKSYQSK